MGRSGLRAEANGMGWLILWVGLMMVLFWIGTMLVWAIKELSERNAPEEHLPQSTRPTPPSVHSARERYAGSGTDPRHSSTLKGARFSHEPSPATGEVRADFHPATPERRTLC